MAKNSETIKNVYCSFCGKPQSAVKKIVAGPGVYICMNVLIYEMMFWKKKDYWN